MLYVKSNAVLLYAFHLRMSWCFEHNEGCGQRLAKFGFWLCEPDSCTTGQSERHHSISSHALVLGEFVATSLTLNLSSCSRYSRPSSCMRFCLCSLFVLFNVTPTTLMHQHGIFSSYNDKKFYTYSTYSTSEGWHAVEICSSCTRSDVQFQTFYAACTL